MRTRSLPAKIGAVGVAAALTLAACGSDEDATSGVTTTEAEAAEASLTIVAVAADAPDFSTLVAAVEAAELVETLEGEGPFTVFAPTNEAFDKLPEGTVDDLLLPENQDQLVDILTYHVVAGEVAAADLTDGQEVETVQGEILTVGIENGVVSLTDAGGATVEVVSPDIEADNGIIHGIDGVVLPASFSEGAEASGDEEAAGTIVDIAAGDENFSTLVGAVTTAELAETLSGEGPFTVFAPTNDAFAALPEGTLESLSSEELTGILTYHVVEGAVLSGDLTDGMEVDTVNGETLTIGVSDEGVTVTDAAGNTVNVTTADLEASNGVIHVIDGVLLPA